MIRQLWLKSYLNIMLCVYILDKCYVAIITYLNTTVLYKME